MKPHWHQWIEKKEAARRAFENYLRKEIVRKIEPSSSLSKVHLAKAFHNLKYAHFTMQHQENIQKNEAAENYHDWVIVISYYAMYHAAMALLYRIGYKADTHLATICILCATSHETKMSPQHLTKATRILHLDEKYIKEIAKGKERREAASYSGSVSFEKQLAELAQSDAIEVVNTIANILEEHKL